ncbi:MAG: hypothetical protein ACK5H1_09465 [Tenacibaculum sp.]
MWDSVTSIVDSITDLFTSKPEKEDFRGGLTSNRLSSKGDQIEEEKECNDKDKENPYMKTVAKPNLIFV